MSGAENILLARMALIQHRSSGGRPGDDDAIVRQYGFSGMAEFWDVVLSETMEAEAFVLALAVHFMVIEHRKGATGEEKLASGRAAAKAESSVCVRLRAALRRARMDQEIWFIEFPSRGHITDPGPTYREVLIYSAEIGPPKRDLALVLPPGPPPDGVDLSSLKVRPRQAVEWLLSMPKRRHLVPPSLVAVMETKTDYRAPVEISARGVGRPAGTSLAVLDAPFVERIVTLVRQGKASSMAAAAQAVVGDGHEVPGGGTAKSKADRLRRAAKKLINLGE